MIFLNGPVQCREVFGHIELVKILVILNPTGYMFTSSGFGLFIWGIFYIFLEMTGHPPEASNNLNRLTLNSTGSFVSNRRFFLNIDWHYNLNLQNNNIPQWSGAVPGRFLGII